MHQLILITAMSATTGLFGGGKHCGGKVHHVRAASHHSKAVYSAPAPAPCGGSASYAQHAMPSMMSSPQMVPGASNAPAAVPAAPPVPTAPAIPGPPTAPPAPPAAS